MKKSAVIAMSGGVDSSVAAFIIKNAGYDCIGATMKLFENDNTDSDSSKICGSSQDIEDAKNIASRLGMDHLIFDFSDCFQEEVIDRFIKAYETGITPNPCITCNRYLKFEKLFLKAKELGYEYIVTGHYAGIEFNEKTGRYNLKKSIDNTKDQSYFLYSLTQEQLAHTLFPLGQMTKAEAREIAEKQGFINARKHDSQDICFVPDGNYAAFIEKNTGKSYAEGNFIDSKGNIMGKHKGIIRYTIGQRKGLGISYSEPLFVSDINVSDNTVTLCTGSELFSDTVYANDINLISVSQITEPMRVKARIRYRQTEQPAIAIQTGEDTLKIIFDAPQRAVTKGQAVVLYDGDTVIGGGTII